MADKVTATIYGLSGGVGNAGGWATLFTPNGPELFRGTLTGTNAGTVPITPLTWNGIGIAGQYLSATIEVECPKNGEFEFGKGDKIIFSGATIAFISIVAVKFQLTCATSGQLNWHDTTTIDPGLGLEGFSTTWQV